MLQQTENKFRWDLSIQQQDIDDLGHVNNTVYVKWIQEVAQAHWQRLLAGRQIHPLAWVVLRHEIDYHHSAMPDDTPFAITWVGDTDAIRSVRHVEIHTVSGRLLASSRTTWCLYDTLSLKPKRITPEIRAILLAEQKPQS